MIQDKIIIITGASSGIGYSTAKALAKKGAKIVAGARRIDRMENLKKKLQKMVVKLLFVKQMLQKNLIVII